MDDLKLIKRHYGEKMMHLCRELFPTILETPGLLYKTLTSKFYPTRFLYNDIIACDYVSDFKNIIYNEIGHNKEKKNNKINVPKNLLKMKGYTLYECKTAADVMKFEKYYRKDERLCTFRDIEGRLERCHVFFAVKKNVDEIKREDFNDPKREDLYGTSVISIQFTKGDTNTLSIKNRYNHTVSNPDATFSNNLDNIIEGLTEAFEEEYNLNINATTTHRDLPSYVLASDGRYYKWNSEKDNVYYCADNIIIDYTNIIQYDKSRYIVFNNIILDKKEKQLLLYKCPFVIEGLIDTIGKIKTISVEKDKVTNESTITINGAIKLVLNEKSELIKYIDPIATSIPNTFLKYVHNIKEIDLPNVEIIGNNFLRYVGDIKKINLPKVRIIGHHFISASPYNNLRELDLPNVEEIGDFFLYRNRKVQKINMPKVKKVGDNFMSYNRNLTEINLPNLKEAGRSFVEYNEQIKKVSLPELSVVYQYFMGYNIGLTKLELPKLVTVPVGFLSRNVLLETISLPKVKKIDKNFLSTNENIKTLTLPNVEVIEGGFLLSNNILRELHMPKCKKIGDFFLTNNKRIKILDIPVITEIDKYKSLRERLDLLKQLQETANANKEKQYTKK